MTATLTDERLRLIAARTSTFRDRLAGGSPASNADGDERLARWRAAVAPADPTLFEKRLRWDGWDDATARRLVGDTEPTAEPGWLVTLQEVYGASDEEVAARFADDPREDRVLLAAEPLPFEELLVPAVRHARARLCEALPQACSALADAAHLNLERALLRRLTTITQRALYSAFTAARLRTQGRAPTPLLMGGGGGLPVAVFRAFVERCQGGGLLDFFADYPVAARLCAIAVEQWITSTSEVVERTARDHAELERIFGGGEPLGQVTRVTCDSGDTHDGGRAVAILEFASGTRVVLKPRSVALDVFWSGLVAWFNAHRGEAPALRAARVLPRDGYGWVEFVPTLPCADPAEVRAYYERSGQTLGLVYALNGNDYHAENIIPSGADPVLIDHEALLTPLAEMPATGASALEAYGEILLQSLRGTVAATGLLPLMRQMRDRQVVVELGGLTAGESPELEVGVVHWRHLHTDLMRMATQRIPYGHSENIPLCGGEPAYAAGYVEEIVRGFTHAYRVALAGRAELHARLDTIRDARVRYLSRNTSLYASLLQRCLHPELLRHGWRRAVELDVLTRPLLQLAEPPAAWPMIGAEVRAMEENDIPLFSAQADATTLDLPTGGEIPGFFATSALDQAHGRLDALDEADLARQVETIRAAFLAGTARGLGPAVPASRPAAAPDRVPAWSAAAALDEATALVEQVESRALRGRHGQRVWHGIQHMADSGRYAVQPVVPSLFDGTLGIALTHAALARATGDPLHARRAGTLVELLVDGAAPSGLPGAAALVAKKDVGAGTGLGGSVYALASIGALLGREEITGAAVWYARQLAPLARGGDTRLGVLNGVAGAMLALLKTHAAADDAQALADAEELAALLVARVREQHPEALAGGGPAPRHPLRGGVPQGAAGMALALLRLHAVRPDAAWLDAAAALLEYDARARAGAAAPDGWATGEAGAALALLELPGGHPARTALDAVLARVEASLLDGGDELANGALGRADLLLCASRGARAREAAMAVVARSRAAGGYDTGWGPHIVHTGLFQGLSGIAYQLARLAAPERIPSVLAWS